MIDIEARLRDALARELPGLDAQLRMAPHPRIGWNPHIPEGLRSGAALLLVYPAVDAGDATHRLGSGDARARPTPHILLTVRAAGLRKHTGQVSLPGGAVDPGESFEAAALREASEEVGCGPSAVRVLGRLTSLQILVSGFLLHPIVGIVDERPDFRRAEWEVARILEVPIKHLQNEAIVKRQKQTRKFADATIEVDVPYFEIEGEKVWGATAMVLAEFLALIGN